MGNCRKCEPGNYVESFGQYRANDGSLQVGVHIRCDNCGHVTNRFK